MLYTHTIYRTTEEPPRFYTAPHAGQRTTREPVKHKKTLLERRHQLQVESRRICDIFIFAYLKKKTKNFVRCASFAVPQKRGTHEVKASIGGVCCDFFVTSLRAAAAGMSNSEARGFQRRSARWRRNLLSNRSNRTLVCTPS